MNLRNFSFASSLLFAATYLSPHPSYAVTAAQRDQCNQLIAQESARRQVESRTGIATTPISVPNYCGALNAQDTTPQAAAPRASLGDFKSVCADVLRTGGKAPAAAEGEAAPSPASQSDLQQKLQHCQAAESAKRAKTASSVTSKVWMAVAGVCTAECVTVVLGGGGFCTVSSLAGTATDMAVTREFTQALMSIGGLGLSSPGMKFGGAKVVESQVIDGKVVGGKSSKFNKGACLAAATSGIQAGMKMMAAKDQQKIMDQEIAAAKQYTTSGSQSEFAPGGSRPNFADAPYGAVRAGAGAVIPRMGTGVAESSDPCAAGEAGNTKAALQCAAKVDPLIPTEVIAKNGFVSAFEKNGVGLSDLLTNQNAGAAEQLTASMAGGMGGDGVRTLASAVKKALTEIGDDPGAVMASSRGGAGGSGGSSEDDAMAQAMAALLKGMNPEDKEVQPGVSETEIEKALRTRSPASIAEDPSISLFDRVTYRYTSVTKQIFAQPASQLQMRGGDLGKLPSAYH
jgi:hypothetical protein